jgi:hypothetical protein
MVSFRYIQVILGLQQFTVKTVLKPEGQKYTKTIKILKMYNYKYWIHPKKQYSQSEMKAIPIYHPSQSRMRLIKLLI